MRRYCGRIPHLYFLDPDEGRDREGRTVTPDFIVDVDEHMELRSACWPATRASAHGFRSIMGWTTTSRRWKSGQEIAARWAGLTYGEGFRQYRCHPYPQSPRLQELLGPLVRNTSGA